MLQTMSIQPGMVRIVRPHSNCQEGAAYMQTSSQTGKQFSNSKPVQAAGWRKLQWQAVLSCP